MLASLGVGLASLGVLVWMIVAGPGYLGYGAALLWTGPHTGAAPLYDIRVTPGDAIGPPQRRPARHRASRRHSDRQGSPLCALPEHIKVGTGHHAAAARGSGFQFLFAGLPESVEYYVEAGAFALATSTFAWSTCPRSSRSA